MTALGLRRLIEEHGKLDGCRKVCPEIEDEEQVQNYLFSYTGKLLQARRYAPAGVLLWGESLFNPKPQCVQRVWKAIETQAKLLIPGGASQGKTYTGVVWTLLDWWADPEFTTVKLISTNEGHAKGNAFGTITMLHREAICQMPGIPRAESLALYESDKRACISIVKIKEGEDNSGALQGFHPLPRLTPHPVFGPSTRVRAVLDEAEEIAGGVWSGCANMLGSRMGVDVIKVMGFYNPKDPTARTAQLSEPPGGWASLDVDSGVNGKDEWVSREGWYVVRLDPAKSENVQQRKVVHLNFQTYEGFQEYKEGSLQYYTFGRGTYPPDSAISTVVPQRVLNLMRGDFIFTGKTIKIGAADIAIDGRDEAIFSAGRFGKASGIRRLVQSKWQTTYFPEERDALQLDQQFSLPKGSAEIVGQAIKTNCIKLGIAPEFMMIDATGNGSPVWNYLKIPEVWSPNVRGVDFSKPATNMRILEQDDKTAEEAYDGIHTEVWFALSRWGEFGYFAIATGARSEELERQLIGRRYLIGKAAKNGKGHRLVVEKKEIYIKRLGRSPDHADSATILTQCARVNGAVIISMTGVASKEDEFYDRDQGGIVDRVTWVNTG